MSFPKSGRRALAAVVLLAATGAAHASSFAYTSTAGEPLGNGVGTRTLASPNATFTAGYGRDTHIVIDVEQDGEHWNIQFRAPYHQADTFVPLHRGSYANAEHAALATPLAPGLEINGPHGNCLDAYGSFKIRQLEFDEDRQVKSLEATFTHRCGSATAPVLTGTLYFNAGPKYFSYSLDSGFPLGSAATRTYHGDTSNLSLAGGLSAFTYGVSGQRDEWYLAFSPPTGKKFAKGVYELRGEADATRAGAYLSDNGEGFCANPTGTLNVRNLAYAGDGNLARLNATFTVACEGSAAQLRGTVRHGL